MKNKLINQNIYLVLILFPIFLSLNFTNGFRFDAHAFNLLGSISIPLSLGLIFVLILINFNKLINLRFVVLFLSITIFLILNFLSGTQSRAMINYIQMLLPIVMYYTLDEYIKKDFYLITYKKFYYILWFVIVSKFILDILLFSDISSIYFLSKYIAIYNYYDYFSFVYILFIIISIYNLEKKIIIKWSFFNILLSYIIIFNMESRLFVALSLLIPLLVLFYKLFKIPLSIIFMFIFLLVVLVTLNIAAFNILPEDPSLYVRFEHWNKYFSIFTYSNFLFPFFNEYRQEINYGSFHNEILEQFSYFGIVVFYYYFIIIKIFSKVKEEFKPYSFCILTILFLGSLLQSNLTNPYLSVIWVSLILIFRKNLAKKEKNVI